ncbi:hypothetical protein [Treponema putidum]|uniref:Uncharacterized protein n=1 Tax=Treponema putidum TaxID=221027 RepID=A0AAE9MX99_9SPIR|nr:hypothetical protein [Treponema putidum]AIN93398.1 hypothetical protein JO40_04110 [Treponema putidum]TWI74468.1 hypothetical protein JM98_02095 [Treponema putidum]UTY29639.1 hypothetical protein E4N76_12185 [Treponema putidum]UTY32110.1 hypothetical protein E4N75_12000 [Treponema putidum]UTY34497.1 hypothetical protein E4N74_11145 [Treponema putidum]
MKNKRICILCILLLLLQNIFADDEREMNVLILLENNSNSTLLYKGWIPKSHDESAILNKDLCNALISMDRKIKKAKLISINNVEKACIIDGEYKVEYLLTGKKYEIQNNYWMYESESKKFYRCDILNELQIIYDCYSYSDFYSRYYLQDTLNIADCKDINFIKWLFTHETDIQIKDKSIEIIEKQYSNGIPTNIEQLPYYYIIKISNEEYNQYKKIYKKSSDWKIFKNSEISFRFITKFDLCCVIKENELIFGFGNMDMIHP